MKISKSRKLRAKYKIKRPEEIQNVLEKIKQTIQAKAARLRRYQKRSRFWFLQRSQLIQKQSETIL